MEYKSSLDALCVYVSPWIAEGRVAWIGKGLSPRVEALLRRLGAVRVHAFVPDTVPVTEGKEEGLESGMWPLPPETLESYRGAFDLVLVPALEPLGWGERVPLQLRALLGEKGTLVGAFHVGASERGSPLRYSVVKAGLARVFPHVRMCGQVLFEGVAMAELGTGEATQVTVDPQLVEEESPLDGVLAVASMQPLPPFPYTVVRLPAGPFQAREHTGEDAVAPEYAALEEKLHACGLALQASVESCAQQAERIQALCCLLEQARATSLPPEKKLKESSATLEAEWSLCAEQLAAARAENVNLRARLDALAMEAACHAGEVQASRWREASVQETMLSPASLEVQALQKELRALRQALIQEHALRLALEPAQGSPSS